MEKVTTKQTKKKKKQVTKKVADVEYNDLCTTCNCLPECDSTSAGRRPVYYCEQYDDYVPQKPAPKPRKAEVKKPKEPEQKYTGICVNCDFRETCANATTEGGIWHCEEYQ